jgi:lysophospholipase
MWTQASSIDKKTERLIINRSVTHYPSAQSGSRFAVISWRAEGVEPTKRLVFVHGALSHSSRHADMFEWMIRKTKGKLQVDALDMVGHGLSSGTRGHVDKFSYWVQDFLTYIHQVEAGDSSTVLMGHSMGGLILLKALLGHEQMIPSHVGSLVLSNPCIRPKQLVEFPKAEEILKNVANYFPTFRLPRLHKGPNLVNNPIAANAFETDPLIPGFITVKMCLEILNASQEVRPLSYFLNKQTLFVLSDDDEVVDQEASLLFARGIDKQRVKVLEYKNTKHELLHEAQCQKVWQNILSWLESL